MNAVQVEMAEQEPTFGTSGPALREQAAARLAAHRERRMRMSARQAEAGEANGPRAMVGSAGAGRSERIAAAVAERYAQTQSYRAFLAAEAESSVRMAQAAAEVATRNAEAIAAARRVLLVELEEMVEAEMPAPARPEPEARLEIVPPPAAALAEHLSQDLAQDRIQVKEVEPPVARSTAGGLTVRLYEDAGRSAREAAEQAEALARQAADAVKRHRRAAPAEHAPGAPDDVTQHETRMLDEEIAYRQSPMDELSQASVAIPGNLLEFPRQLVATRKARPRYAEGPLRDEADADSQLRIFEVEAVRTEAPTESAAPEWSSIWLDALAQDAPEETVEEARYSMAQRPYTAALSRRMMAAAVDGGAIAAGYLAFAMLFVQRASALPGLGVAAGGSVAVLLCLYLMYRMLFFTFSDATPGMRCARIALCTFADENPTRAAMRRRILTELLAACPLGIGLLWACLDDDRLGWHDRISRMYPRGY